MEPLRQSRLRQLVRSSPSPLFQRPSRLVLIQRLLRDCSLAGTMGLANAERTLDILKTLAIFIAQPEYKDVVPV